jgi:DNA-binding CsgD family transcriptional regulator
VVNLTAVQGRQPASGPSAVGDQGVTRRESEVLAALADRRTNAEIAALLYISPRTVESHVSSLLRKLGATDRFELGEIAKRSAAPDGRGLPAPLELLVDPRTYVGREPEVAELDAAWQRVCGGRLLVAVVEGDAGIGKSRLVSEFAQRVLGQGARILFGSCTEDLDVPYQGFAEALLAEADDLSDHELRRRASDARGALIRIVPALAGRLGVRNDEEVVDAPGERAETLAALEGYLHRTADHGPILLVLEDLHWATTSTRDMLLHLARRSSPAPVLVVATMRDHPPDLDEQHAKFLARLRGLPSVRTIELCGLDEAQVDDLLAHIGADDDPGWIWRETDGNPLLVRELAGLPEPATNTSVRALLRRRHDLLGSDDLQVLEMAAVLGAEFDADLLAAALERPLLDVLESLERADAAGLVVASPGEPGRFAFTHALFRTATYEAISYSQQLRLHQLVATALEPHDHDERLLPVLARHACAAAPIGDATRAFELGQRAGELAERSLALDEAAAQYRAALGVSDRLGPEHAAAVLRVRIRLGETLNRIGDPEHRAVLLEAADIARRLGEAHALAEIAWALTQYGASQSIGASDPDLVGIAEDALAGLGPAPTATRARTLAALASDLGVSDTSERAYQMAGEALTIARTLDDPITLGCVLLSYRWAARSADNAEARHPTADELVSLGRRTNQSIFTILGLVNRAMSLREEGKLLECDEVVELYAELIGERPVPPNVRAQLIMFRAMRQFLAGHLDDAQRVATAVMDLTAAGSFDPSRFFGLALYKIRHLQGRLAELVPGLEALTGEFIGVMRSLAYAHADRPDDAAAVLRESFRHRRLATTRRHLWLPEALLFAEVAEMTHESDIAADLLPRLEPFSGRLAGGLVVDGPVDLAIAQAALAAGDLERSATYARRGIDTSRMWQTPIYLGRHLLVLAQARRRAGAGPGEVQPLVLEAVTIGRRTGADVILRDAERFGLVTDQVAVGPDG